LIQSLLFNVRPLDPLVMEAWRCCSPSWRRWRACCRRCGHHELIPLLALRSD